MEAIVCDPVEGEGNTTNDNPGTDYVFTDESGEKRAQATMLTLKRTGADDATAVTIPLGSTSTLTWNDFAGFTFEKGEGNELALDYGLLFPENMTAVDFKSHLPKEGDTSVAYPIARLYYTLGLAN